MVQIASDNFQRANENPLGNGNWTTVTGTTALEISSNKLIISSAPGGPGASAYWSSASFPEQQYAEVVMNTLTSASANCGVLLRVNSGAATQTCYTGQVEGTLGSSTTLIITQILANTETVLATASSPTVNVGDVIKLEASGALLTLKVNGTQVLTAVAQKLNSGPAGVHENVTSVSVTNVALGPWDAGSLTSLSPVTITDNFNRANQNPLAGNWVTVATQNQALQIVSNALEAANAGVNAYAVYNAIQWPDDQSASVTIGTLTNSSCFISALVRFSTANLTGYQMRVQGATGAAQSVLLLRIDAGSFTTIKTVASITANIGDVFTVQAQGTTFTLLQNAVSIGTVTDATYTSGWPGISINGDTVAHAIVTNFQAGSVGFSISGNAGVSGATVTLGGDGLATTTADGSGNYSFANLPNSSFGYTVTPSLAGHVFSPNTINKTVSGANVTGVNFTSSSNLPDTIGNSICRPAMIYGRAPNGVMSAVTTDGSGNIDLSGQTPAFVDTIGNGICLPVMIYGRAPNGQLQAVTTDGDGQLS